MATKDPCQVNVNIGLFCSEEGLYRQVCNVVDQICTICQIAQ